MNHKNNICVWKAELLVLYLLSNGQKHTNSVNFSSRSHMNVYRKANKTQPLISNNRPTTNIEKKSLTFNFLRCIKPPNVGKETPVFYPCILSLNSHEEPIPFKIHYTTVICTWPSANETFKPLLILITFPLAQQFTYFPLLLISEHAKYRQNYLQSNIDLHVLWMGELREHTCKHCCTG